MWDCKKYLVGETGQMHNTYDYSTICFLFPVSCFLLFFTFCFLSRFLFYVAWDKS